MATAIITLIAAVDVAAYRAAAHTAAGKARDALVVYQQQCERLKTQHPGRCTDDTIRQIERGWQGWLPAVSHHADWLHYQRAVNAAKSADFLASRASPSPAKIRIAVVHSYDIRGALKALGYRFDPDGHWRDVFGLKVSAAWTKEFSAADSDEAAILAAVQQLKDMGVVIQLDSKLNNLAVSLRSAMAG